MASSGSESEYEVDYILDMRKKGRSFEYKVRWKGFGEEEDSWEPLKNLKTATAAIEAFKKKGAKEQTPSGSSRISKRSSARTSSSTTGTSVTTTKTVTRTETFSDGSDNEASPVMTRRSTRTVTETRMAGGDRAAAPAAAAAGGKCGFLQPACACVASLRNDLPMLIYFTCLAVIAGTFVWEYMYPK